MEIADCMLKLGNDQSSKVFKVDVTPAEVIVLQVIHGPGSVTDIKIKSLDTNNKSIDRRSHRSELARLRNLYQGDGNSEDLTGSFIGGQMADFDPSKSAVVDRIFPGLNPVLPIKFDDLNIKPEDEDEEEEEHDEESQIEEPVKEGSPAPKAAKRGRPVLREIEPANA